MVCSIKTQFFLGLLFRFLRYEEFWNKDAMIEGDSTFNKYGRSQKEKRKGFASKGNKKKER